MNDQIAIKIKKDIEINREKENIRLLVAIVHLDQLLQNLNLLLVNTIDLKWGNT